MTSPTPPPVPSTTLRPIEKRDDGHDAQAPHEDADEGRPDQGSPAEAAGEAGRAAPETGEAREGVGAGGV
jgi:hypothetical protein